MGLPSLSRQFVLVVAVSGVCFAQPMSPPVNAVFPAEATRVTLDELRAQGYDALFSLDYETAYRVFHEMTRVFPDHPAGPQCLAATLWLQELNRSRHRQASLYSTESFAAGEDVHLRTAAEVLGLPITSVTPQQRDRAKAVNFGIVYGQTPFGLAQQLGIAT